jgi:hypothetical protein
MTAQGNYWVVVYDDPGLGEMLSRQVDTREQALDLACAFLTQPVAVRALRGPGRAEVTLDQIKRECAAKARTSSRPPPG